MSARAAGAYYLRQMALEELIQAPLQNHDFRAQFYRKYAAEVAAYAATKPVPKMLDQYARGAMLWKAKEEFFFRWLAFTVSDIDRAFERHVAEWGDWWVARYSEVNDFIRETLERIANGTCECVIGPLHVEAFDEDFCRALDEDMTVSDLEAGEAA